MFHISMLCGVFLRAKEENCELSWDADVFVNPVDYLVFLAMVYN